MVFILNFNFSIHSNNPLVITIIIIKKNPFNYFLMRPDTRERDIKTVLFFILIPLYKWLRLTNKFNAETWSFMLFINIIFYFNFLVQSI